MTAVSHHVEIGAADSRQSRIARWRTADTRIGRMEMLGIGNKRATCERHGLGVGLGDDDMAGRTDQRILALETRIVPGAAGFPDLPELLRHLARDAAERVHPLLGGALQI